MHVTLECNITIDIAGHTPWSRFHDLNVQKIGLITRLKLVHATTDPSKSTQTLVEEAQQALHLWEDLIRATGGALAPEKSYWYLLEVCNKNGQWV